MYDNMLFYIQKLTSQSLINLARIQTKSYYLNLQNQFNHLSICDVTLQYSIVYGFAGLF